MKGEFDKDTNTHTHEATTHSDSTRPHCNVDVSQNEIRTHVQLEYTQHTNAKYIRELLSVVCLQPTLMRPVVQHQKQQRPNHTAVEKGPLCHAVGLGPDFDCSWCRLELALGWGGKQILMKADQPTKHIDCFMWKHVLMNTHTTDT